MMKRIKFPMLAASVATLAILASAPAVAQDASASAAVPQDTGNDVGGAGEIVVTANKREQNLSDVGLSVAVVGSEQLDIQQIATGADIARITPSLVYTPTSKNTPVYTLRGVGFYENSLAAYPDVSLYMDQAPFPLPVFATRSVFDLERVEVLKGPQGTLFGNNATGGAINFIAAKPTRDFSAGVELGYGRFNTVTVGGYVSGPLSDTLRARLAVQAAHGDEWQRSITRNDKLGTQNNVAARFLLDWEPTDRLTLSLNINGWRDKDDPQAAQVQRRTIVNPPGSVGFGGVVPADLPVLSTPVIPEGNIRDADWSPELRPYTDNRFFQTALRADYEILDGVTLTSLTSYDHLRFRNQTDEDGSALVGFQTGDHRARARSFNQELRLSNGGRSGFRWVVGGNYERTKVFEIADNVSYDSTSGAVNGAGIITDDNNQRMTNYAGFANAEYDILSNVTLKSGIRFSQANRYSDVAAFNRPGEGPIDGLPYTFTEFFNLVYGAIYGGMVPPVAPGNSIILDTRTNADGSPVDPATYLKTGRYVGRLKESSTSWSVGVDFKATPDLLFYANVAKGYKSGSFPFLAASIYTGLDPVKQEALLDYEVGFKADLLDRKLSVTGAAFYYDYRNKQLLTKFVDPIFGQLDRLANVPKSSVKGAEIALSGRPAEGLDISASVTYLDAKVKDYIGVVGLTVGGNGLLQPVNASFAGVVLPFSAKWNYSVRADYNFPISSGWNGLVGAGLNGQSTTYSTLALTAQDQDDYRIRPYALASANLGVETADGKYRVVLWGKNIFNKYYVTNRFLAYDTQVRMVGRPAEYGVTVSAKF